MSAKQTVTAEGAPGIQSLQAIESAALEQLADNIQPEGYITPSRQLYGAGKNKWGYSWDTALAAWALAEHKPDTAAALITNYLSAQHSDGLIPHMVMWSNDFPVGSLVTHGAWHGWRHPGTDAHGRAVHTSHIDQPPLFAVAAAAVVDQLPEGAHRHRFARTTASRLLAYRQHLYDTRELNRDGLIVNLHPQVTGRDDAPSHQALLMAIPLGWRERLWLSRLSRRLFEANRTDKTADPATRSHNDIVMRAAALAMFHLTPLCNRGGPIPKDFPYQHYDVGFNAILDRDNQELRRLAALGNLAIAPELIDAMERTSAGLQQFWDPAAHAFRSLDGRGKVAFAPGQEIGDALPIVSCNLTTQQRRALIAAIQDPAQFAGKSLRSVSLTSPVYTPNRFWMGAAWPMAEQLVIDGLWRSDRSDAQDEAIRQSTAMLSHTTKDTNHHSPEYRHAETGEPCGAAHFTGQAAAALGAAKLLRLSATLQRESDERVA